MGIGAVRNQQGTVRSRAQHEVTGSQIVLQSSWRTILWTEQV